VADVAIKHVRAKNRAAVPWGHSPDARSPIGGRQMIEVRRLGHATLTTPDLDRQVAYYTEVVGLTLLERDSKRAVLASKQGFEAIALEPGLPNALSRLAFQVAPGSDLADVTPQLATQRGESERRT